jgi:CRP-like cAMP-binding protein
LSNPLPLHDQLVLGRRKLKAIFDSSPPRTLNAAELLGVAGASGGIYRLKAGWACQFHDLANGRRTILDVYLPGDVIGLNGAVHPRPLEEVVTLTATIVETIPAQDVLAALIADQSIGLYISFLLGLRQRRSDRVLAAISGLDARGRLAMMLLDFYTRLRRRKLTLGSSYNLPLSQGQIGNYLGLTVVHINRVLRSLRAERIVNLEKHCVMILDLERLTFLAQNGGQETHQLAGECRLGEAAD